MVWKLEDKNLLAPFAPHILSSFDLFMAGLMGVQTRASLRNEHVEFFIDFVLRELSARLSKKGLLLAYSEPLRQVEVKRDDGSDVFDHFLTITPRAARRDTLAPEDIAGRKVAIWAQTTSYKGNETGKAEANKTYEIRETLIESLSLRRWLIKEGAPFRMIHFTVGPATYSYGWMKGAKDSAFDVSLYLPHVSCSKFFAELSALLSKYRDEVSKRAALHRQLNDSSSAITVVTEDYIRKLTEWIAAGMPRCGNADKQAELLDSLRLRRKFEVNRAIAESKKGGAGIKLAWLQFLSTGKSSDPLMLKTAKILLSKNPFLAIASSALERWPEWAGAAFIITASTNLENYVSRLWNLPVEARLISRRLLLKIHSDTGVDYVQDNIPGITEHVLYTGNHTVPQVQRIVERICGDCRANGLVTPMLVRNQLVGQRGYNLLRQSFSYEGKNGTELKPSFHYAEQYLMPEFQCVPLSKSGLAAALPYYRAFTTEKVSPYTNLKAVYSVRRKRYVAVLKAAFFREPEFPRRVKENAYVGLTLKNELRDGVFVERYDGLPLIMFVDMEKTLIPPEFAVKRLVNSGWDVFFSLDAMKNRLAAL